MGADLVGFVTEDFFSASGCARFSKDVDDILLMDKSGCRVFLFDGGWLEPGVDGCINSCRWIIMQDAINDSPPELWRAHESVICARLGATFFLVSVLLVWEGDGDEPDVSIEILVEWRDDGAPHITAAKDNVADC